MRKKVKLYTLVSLPNGKRQYVKITLPKATGKRGAPEKPKVPVNAGDFYLRYVKGDGKRGYENVGSDLELAVFALEEREQILAGVIPAPDAPKSSVTLKDYIDVFLTGRKGKKQKIWREKTLEANTRVLNLFHEITGNKPFTALTAQDINRFTTALQGRNFDTNSVYQYFRTLISFINYITTSDDPAITGSDNVTVRVITRIRKAHIVIPEFKDKIPVVYSEEQCKLFIQHATEDELDLIAFLYGTGCRRGEAAHCEWSNVQWHKRTLEIKDKKVETKKKKYDWEIKDSEQREITLSQYLLDRLRARKDRMAAKPLPPGVKSNNYETQR